MFIKWIGWMRSPDGICTICSSAATFLQLKPSDANSIVLRAAFWYSSLAEHHILSLLGYSVRIGIGITATSWWRDTRRLVFVFDVIVGVGQLRVTREVCNSEGWKTTTSDLQRDNFRMHEMKRGRHHTIINIHPQHEPHDVGGQSGVKLSCQTQKTNQQP